MRGLYWQQGTFVTPQHMQQLDALHADSLSWLWQIGLPQGWWGLKSFRPDESGLTAGRISVLNCELIAYDGTRIVAGADVAHGNAVIAERDLRALEIPAGSRIELFLALPNGHRLHGDDRPPAFTGNGPLPPRHCLQRQERADRFDATAPVVDLIRVANVLSIVTSQDPGFAAVRESAMLLPVAALDSSFQPDSAFIPPVISVGASPALIRLLTRLRDALSRQLEAVSKAKRQRTANEASVGAPEVLRILVMQTLGRWYPVFEHLVQHRYGHPEGVYRYLRVLVGELSAFDESVSAGGFARAGGGFAAYDHWRLRESLEPLVDAAIGILEKLSSGPRAGVRMQLVGPSANGHRFEARLPVELLENRRNRFILVARSPGRSGAELHQEFQQLGKLWAAEDIDRLVQHNLSGLSLKLLDGPPTELPQNDRGATYFELSAEGPGWQSVQRDGRLAADLRMKPDEFELTVVPLEVTR